MAENVRQEQQNLEAPLNDDEQQLEDNEQLQPQEIEGNEQLQPQEIAPNNAGGIFIDVRRQVFRIDGGPEMVRAVADAAIPVATAASGGYLVYRVANHPAFLDAVTQVFRDAGSAATRLVEGLGDVAVDTFRGLGQVIVENITGGSLNVTVLTKHTMTSDVLSVLSKNGIILKKLNKSLQEYGSKFNDPQPEFTNVTLVEEKNHRISEDEFEKLKQKADLNMQDVVQYGIKDDKQAALPKKENGNANFSPPHYLKPSTDFIAAKDQKTLTMDDLRWVVAYHILMDKGKTKQARMIEKGRRPLHPDWHFVGNLIQQYKQRIDAKELYEASQLQKELGALLQITSSTDGQELKSLCSLLTSSGHRVIGNLFFNLSSEMYFNTYNDELKIFTNVLETYTNEHNTSSGNKNLFYSIWLFFID